MNREILDEWIAKLRSDYYVANPPMPGWTDNSFCMLGILCEPTEEDHARAASLAAERVEHLARYEEIRQGATGLLRALIEQHAPSDGGYPHCTSCYDRDYGFEDWPCTEADLILYHSQ